MTTAQLKASRRLWRARELSRHKRLIAAKKRPARAAEVRRLNNLYEEARKTRIRRDRQIQAREDAKWGGSRAVTNKIVRIVNGRAKVTSRKRSRFHPLSRQNPGSDHSGQNKHADAVDFAIADAHWLKNEISRKLGGPSVLADYGTFNVKHGGKTFRVQLIAGTHGTGPHLHAGVRRVYS